MFSWLYEQQTHNETVSCSYGLIFVSTTAVIAEIFCVLLTMTCLVLQEHAKILIYNWYK